MSFIGANPGRGSDASAPSAPMVSGPELWKDPTQPTDARVQDLLRRMSLAEKASQIMANAPAIPRLGIHAYSHRNECLHGVVNSNATVFPQAIGMAATWDPQLIQNEAGVIATEARATHNDYVARNGGDSGEHFGVNFYSPNLNIFRDPRWGRGQETYGEDPFLVSQFGVAFIRGLQGDDPKYLKAAACAKHFAVHSGPEVGRHRFNARPPERDLYETYLPAFEAAVRQGHVASAMGAYSALYGVPCCADSFLLTQLLRKQWGFSGVVLSDGGAVGDIKAGHHYVGTLEDAAATSVKAGCDISSGPMAGKGGGAAFSLLHAAVTRGLVSESAVDTAVRRELTMRFRLGLFDPPSKVPWSKLTLADVDTPAHQARALKVAEESIVLLKNNGLLPLNRAKIKRVAVIGPNADSANALLGSYGSRPPQTVTILDSLKAVAGTNIEVTYAPGCPLALKNDNSNRPTSEMTAQTIAAARSADVVIYVGGIDSTLENEENHDLSKDCQGFDHGDRTRIELPAPQEDLLKAIRATRKPIVFVNCSGSAIAMPWEAKHLSAIVQAWYPGEHGAKAVAEALFGEVNPAGRLPITFYSSTGDLPSFTDYSMSNRTYRYFNGKPVFAFGHGLSYTTFKYSKAKLANPEIRPSDILHISFTLKNNGCCEGDEVVQAYFQHVRSVVPQPRLALCRFQRIHLKKGESADVIMDIPAERFRYWDTSRKEYTVEPGKYELLIGAASDDIRLKVPLVIQRPLG